MSESAVDLISNAQRTDSQSNYISDWRKWASWFHGKWADPSSNHLREVLDFLAKMFELKYEYCTTNTHRSAIFAFHEIIQGFLVREHLKVCNLTTGA